MRVVLFLEEHGDKPVFEPQFARAEDAPAKGVVLQAALAVEHGIAHALAVGQPGVKGLHKPARGLDQHAVAHGHDGGHAALQQLGSDGLGGVFRLGGLAGFEEDQRNPVVLQQRAELVGVDGHVAAVVEFVRVARILEAQPAEADAAVIDAVAIEVDDVIRCAGVEGAFEFLAQGVKRGRAEHVEPHEAAELFHGLDQRQRAGAVINVTAGLVLRPRGDEQDADRRRDHGNVEGARIRQAPADAGGLRALKEITVAVVEQFPRKAEQERGGLANGLGVSGRGSGFQRRIHVTRRSGGPRDR